MLPARSQRTPQQKCPEERHNRDKRLRPAGWSDCRLTASVIVYRGRLSLPEGVQHPVTDLVPVWWEFHTTQAGGEVLNDFDFSELKRCV